MFTVDQVRAALGTSLRAERAGSAIQFDGVTNDSRVAKRGDLFVALATPVGFAAQTRDGHDFIGDAVARGAAGVIFHRESLQLPDGVWGFQVDDTQHAIGSLASAWRDRFDLKPVVIAGNVGKTTTKELTAAVLSGCGHSVLKSPKNFNDEIGLSMTLFQLDETFDRAVLEVGMFELGEIRRLCQIAKPHIGVVLNVGPTHLARLGSMDAIARAKREAIERLPDAGFAILNADDERVIGMAGHTRAHVLTFGMRSDAHLRAVDINSHALEGTEFTLEFGGRRVRAKSPVPGVALVSNALAAVAVALADGATLEEAAEALSTASITPRLHVRIATSGAIILDDCYNANPASMRAALDVLGEVSGRRYALLGDMLDLGTAEQEGHRSVGEYAANIVDALYTVGPRSRVLATAARDAGLSTVHHFSTKQEAVEELRPMLGAGDVLLIKASLGMGFSSVVADLAG